MTRCWPYIAVTLLCSVLAVATPTSAECAWVVWTAVFLSNQRDLVSYTRGPAYLSARECIKPLDTEAARWRELVSQPKPLTSAKRVERTESTELFVWREGGADVYRCYPDTVDPRGPKVGK